MKRLMMAMTLAATGAVYGAGLFECTVLDGVVKRPGKVKVETAINRDCWCRFSFDPWGVR